MLQGNIINFICTNKCSSLISFSSNSQFECGDLSRLYNQVSSTIGHSLAIFLYEISVKFVCNNCKLEKYNI